MVYATVPCSWRGYRFALHEAGPAEPAKPRLLDRVRAAARLRHYGRRTEAAYVAWIRRSIFFHGKRHPAELGACCRLRTQDIDFAAHRIVVRGGEGDRDRVTMLPAMLKSDLARHLEGVRAQHQRDLHQGAGWVERPTALARKYPNAGRWL